MMALKMWFAKYQLALTLLAIGTLSSLWLYEKVQLTVAESKITSLNTKVSDLEENNRTLREQAESVSEGNRKIIDGNNAIDQQFSGITGELQELLNEAGVSNQMQRITPLPTVRVCLAETPTATPPPTPMATTTPTVSNPREIILAWEAFEIAKKAGTP